MDTSLFKQYQKENGYLKIPLQRAENDHKLMLLILRDVTEKLISQSRQLSPEIKQVAREIYGDDIDALIIAEENRQVEEHIRDIKIMEKLVAVLRRINCEKIANLSLEKIQTANDLLKGI